jgi:hypothetical protein
MSLQLRIRTRITRRIDTCRGRNTFKRSYQTRNNSLEDEIGDLLADFHNIFNCRKKYFFRLLNVYSVNDVKKIVIHTA